jgi:hypothetical protein
MWAYFFRNTLPRILILYACGLGHLYFLNGTRKKGNVFYETLTVSEKAVSLPLVGSHDRLYTAMIFCSPMATVEMSQICVPPDPTSFPVVLDGT